MENNAKPPSKWILAGLIVLTSGIMVLLGYIYLVNQIRGIREVNFHQLSSIAKLKAGEISQWHEERLSDLRVALENPALREAAAALAVNPDDASALASLREIIQSLVTHYEYQTGLVTDPDGAILFSHDEGMTELEDTALRLVADASAAKAPRFGDFFRSELDGQVYLDLAGPLLDGDGRVAAVLLLRINPNDFLYPFIQSWPTPSKTAETLIVRREGDFIVFLNTLRHKPEPPLSVRFPVSRTDMPAVQAFQGVNGDIEGVDYRGEPVFATTNSIPGTAWYLVTKIDRQEVAGQIAIISGFIAALVLMGILLTTGLLVYFFKRRQRVLYRNLYESEKGRLKALEETRTILYSIGDGVIATDDQGRVTYFNPVAEGLTGWKESEAAGRELSEVFKIINENTLEPVENPIYRVLREGIIVGLANHTLLIRRDGSQNPIADSGAPVRDEQGNITGVVLVFRDQSSERAAQRERALLTNAIRSSLDEIYVFDAVTMRFMFINDGALKNLGYSMEEMLLMTPLDIKPEMTAEELTRIIQPLLDHRLPIQVFETVHQRRDGSRYPVEVHLQLHDDEFGHGNRLFMAIIQDVTRRKKDEEAILTLNAELEQRVVDRTIQLQASNRELEAFAYSISHDLRGPLRGIDGWSHALLEDNLEQLDVNGRQYLERIRGEAQKMGHLIDDLLELSRVTRIDMTMVEVDLGDIAAGIIARLRELDSGRDVEYIAGKRLIARGDPQLLEVALTNLLDNAWKFTATREKARIEFGKKVWDGRHVFFLCDNGVGFDMEYSSKLFGPFQRLHRQTEFPGLGIGLATAHRIIQRHGGTIWPESKPGEGTTFFFTLMEME